VKTFEGRLTELGMTLPEAPKPVAAYVPARKTGDLLYVSGQGPVEGGAVRYAGKVGSDISIEDGAAAARLCALNCLAQVRAALGTLDRVRQVVKVVGFVNAGPDFTQQPQVINGASELLIEVFGEAGRHARSAVGCASLPLNIAVEVEMVVEVAPYR
jgi:enamine deaminase RidA (YjgF/YER057c/UK114 family)